MGNNSVNDIFEFLQSNIVIIPLFTWFGTVLAKKIDIQGQGKINKEIENLKAANEKNRLMDLENIKALNAKELETSKAILLEKIKYFEIRANAINQQRLSLLKENYELLVEVWLDCRWAIQPDELGREKPPANERLEKALTSLDVYFKDFERKKLFLSDASQEAVYDFIHNVMKSLNNLRIFDNSTDTLEKRLQNLYEPWIHDLKPRIDTARKSIESEYKALIGLEA